MEHSEKIERNERIERNINTVQKKEEKIYNSCMTLYGIRKEDGTMLMDNLTSRELKETLGIENESNLDAWLVYNEKWNGYYITEKNRYESKEFATELNDEHYRFFVREDGFCYKVDKKTHTKYEMNLLDDGQHLYPEVSNKIAVCKNYPMEKLITKYFFDDKSNEMVPVFVNGNYKECGKNNIIPLTSGDYKQLLFAKGYFNKTRNPINLKINGNDLGNFRNYNVLIREMKRERNRMEKIMRKEYGRKTRRGINTEMKIEKMQVSMMPIL